MTGPRHALTLRSKRSNFNL